MDVSKFIFHETIQKDTASFFVNKLYSKESSDENRGNLLISGQILWYYYLFGPSSIIVLVKEEICWSEENFHL